MIISEKQIMQLMQCANNFIHLMQFISLEYGLDYEGAIKQSNELLGAINSQQSEELKVIE